MASGWFPTVMVFARLLLRVLTTPTALSLGKLTGSGTKFGNVTYAVVADGATATKFGAEFAGRLMVLVLEMTVPMKFSLVIESATVPSTEWFTTKTSLAACCTAWTGARPTSATLTSVSPETSITMALPKTRVPLSLIDTTVWAAAGLGNTGGLGMIIGRKVSPRPV